ncbi:hypothetical protein [Microbacterium amylolyticum]|uniref:DUF4129 domain-containing protein n=1 Tax=Microbacterium amylolyticum TaxID=936337 RepID=A0ABS4ZI13_9MICO|nr:hypothetical protein [Microbacterium amylolyticum]MBP2436919.1 hypothetical protein [Microbacterium amylolyticum]
MFTDELYPPVQYSPVWMLVACGVLALLALIAWMIWALTRPPKAVPSSLSRDEPETLDALRDGSLGAIAQVEDAYRSGAITARHANAELSRLTRAFVNAYTGVEAPVMTLEDLERRGVDPSLIDALRRHYYPSLFRGDLVVDPIAGADAARRVVMAWH